MTAVTLALFEAAFASALQTLEAIKSNRSSIFTEADLQSRLFMALFNMPETPPEGARIVLHCEPRFFASPENKKRGIYPDICILDRSSCHLSKPGVSTKGYDISGSCIQIEIKLRRDNRGNASPKRWIRDLEKLASFRENWSSIDRGEGNDFFPIFAVYSRLPIISDELEQLRENSDRHKVWAIAIDDTQSWQYTPELGS